jgi:hypothetical protein
MRRDCAPLALLVLIASLTVTFFAQTPDTVTVRGRVLDPAGARIPGVTITLTNNATAAGRNATSNASGFFTFSGLPVGTYTLTTQKEGFAETTQQLKLAGGRTAELELQLNVNAAKTHLVVTGTVGQIRTDEPQLGDLIELKQIEQMPLLNNRITYLPLLNAANRPALNQGDAFMNQNLFTTNGSGRRQTAWVVDGATGNDMWGRQTTFTNIPQVAVQEMTVLENAFSAEYGATMGGVVNITTRQGGNQFHGDLLTAWRPNGTSAKLSGFTAASATNGNQVVTDSLGLLSGSLSGPIPGSEGRTHFFLAGEYSRQNRGSPVTSPIAPQVFAGHYAGWMTFLRLDHQLDERNQLFLRANTDSFHDTNPNGAVGGNNLPTVDRIFRRRTYSVEAGETAELTSSLLNSARAQFQLASPITQFDPLVYGTQFVVPVSTGGTFTTGTSQSALLLNRQYEFTDTVSSSWRRHQLKFGVEVIHAHNGGDSKEYGGPIFLGQFQYNTCTQPLTVCESAAYLNDITNVRSYTQSYGNANYTVGDTLWALFVQDDVRVKTNLTINLGLRYERQTFTDSTKNIAPRVGFSYDPFDGGKTVIRGGFGIYYAQVVDNSAANYTLSGPTGVFNYTAQPGQIGFPTSIADAPLPQFPSGAIQPVRSLYIRPGRSAYYNQFFDTSLLKGYPEALLSPYSEQWSFGIERQLAPDWVLSVDYVGSHSLHIVRPLDLDAPPPFVRTEPGQVRSAQAANCTRPLWVAFYADAGRTCDPTAPNPPQPAYGVILSDVNNGFGTYNALNVNLSHHFAKRFTMLASYVYSHAINNVDPDIPNQNPNDPNFTGQREKGNAIFDQRHRFVLSGIYNAPWGVSFGGIATAASALPFNIVTGTTNSGDPGATTDRPVINGVVVGRNTGRGRPIYDFSPFVEKDFRVTESLHVRARAESLNIFNHANFVGYSGTYGNGPTPGNGFGQPLSGITNQLPARSFQFSLRLSY